MIIPKTLKNIIAKVPLQVGIIALLDYSNGVPCFVLIDRLKKYMEMVD